MKKIIKYIIILSIGLYFTGCAEVVSGAKVYENNITGSKKVVSQMPLSVKNIEGLDMAVLLPREQYIAVGSTHIKMALKTLAEETIKNGFTNFIIMQDDMDQRTGMFPFTKFEEVKEYCFNLNYSLGQVGTEKKCIPISKGIGTNTLELSFIMLNNPDYRITSFNAKKILEEINSYKLTKEDMEAKIKVEDIKKP